MPIRAPLLNALFCGPKLTLHKRTALFVSGGFKGYKMNGFKLYQVAPGKFALFSPSGAKLREPLARAMFASYAKQFQLVDKG